MKRIDFKALLENHNLKEVVDKLREDLDSRKVKPESFSLRRLWEQTVGPIEQTLDRFIQESGFVAPLQESVDTTAFHVITGEVIAQKIMDAYQSREGVADKLVHVVPSNFRTENVVGFTALESLREVAEGMPYEESGFGEKYVQIDNTKYGRILSITEEAIQFDQTGQLLARASQFGVKARMKRERIIQEGVIDANYSAGVSGVYKPSGTVTQLYSTTNGNLNTSAGTLNDTNLATAYAALRSMTDEEGDFIMPSSQMILMCHPAVFKTARVYANSTLIPGSSNNDVNFWKGMFLPVENPYIPEQTTWFLGDFAAQFRWQEVWPLQVMRAIAGNDFDFQRDIRAAFKVRFFGGVGATDYRFVQKQTA